MRANEFNHAFHVSGALTVKEAIDYMKSIPAYSHDVDMLGEYYGEPDLGKLSEAFNIASFEIASEALCPGGEHLWEDDSYGGPESGCMAGHCTRCGHSFHHTLY